MAVEELYTKGVSDIVETEGNLPRFTKICQEFYPHKLYGWDEIIPLVRKIAGFKVNSPIQRHIAIFKQLSILEQRDNMYTVSSEGRALLALTKDKTLEKRLILPEKIFYFRTLFHNALYQLFILLQTINQKQEQSDPKEVVVEYFRRIMSSSLRLWKKETLRRDIEIYKSRGHLRRGLQNKFGCMKAWLRHLELLEGKGLALSPLGKEVLSNIEFNGTGVSYRIYAMANIYINGEVNTLPHFNYSNNNHKQLAIELFNLTYPLFERHELKMSDAKSMKCFVCIEMLVKHQITMEESDFTQLLHHLHRENLIRSIMADDVGKLAYVSKK